MQIVGNGIILHRLTEDKIELVRYWRNHSKIQQYMDYCEHITTEQQKRWFAFINNDKNYYFIVEMNGRKIGFVDIKN